MDHACRVSITVLVGIHVPFWCAGDIIVHPAVTVVVNAVACFSLREHFTGALPIACVAGVTVADSRAAASNSHCLRRPSVAVNKISILAEWQCRSATCPSGFCLDQYLSLVAHGV